MDKRPTINMDVFNIRNQKVEIGDDGSTTVRRSSTEAYTQLRAHNRRFERQQVDYPVTVRLKSAGGDLLDQGDATIRDMTPEGAFIGNLRLEHGRLPLEEFQLEFRVEDGDLKGIEGSCRPVRITSGEGVGFGVKFKQVYVKILGEDLDDSELGIA